MISNDQDTDGTIVPATVVIINNPVNGTAVHNGDGTVTYTPATGYTGDDTFTYTVKDNDGATSNEATVTVLTGAVGFYFPPPGEGLDKQIQLSPEEIGLDPAIISELQDKAISWALWRHGYLVHVKGSFNAVNDVASIRKTWHALTVGAAIKQGKIPSYNQKISVWQTELTGNDADATWWHVMTQSTGFDYPYDSYPDFISGEMWTYSDLNLVHINHALAKAYGKQDFYDNYDDVLKEAYFDAIGMQGWSTRIAYDEASQMYDGIRLKLDLEDMGRLGLFVLARGKWNGIEVVPQWFVEELERKQTNGMQVNYDGPNNGILSSFLNSTDFPESPYGFMTWVNTDGNYYPGADTFWAFGRGLDNYILWNTTNGIVFVGKGVQANPTSDGIPHIIERNITGPNPLIP